MLLLRLLDARGFTPTSFGEVGRAGALEDAFAEGVGGFGGFGRRARDAGWFGC